MGEDELTLEEKIDYLYQVAVSVDQVLKNLGPMLETFAPMLQTFGPMLGGLGAINVDEAIKMVR